MDLGYLLAYSLGMFSAGHVADRVDLRVFLAWGMVLGGLMTSLAGLAYYWEIHSFWYFGAVMVGRGLQRGGSGRGWSLVCGFWCVEGWCSSRPNEKPPTATPHINPGGRRRAAVNRLAGRGLDHD
jgi:sugar phosphate permease